MLISCGALGGNVSVGDGSFLGLNACIKENSIIGQENIIASGVFVKRNTAANTILTGGAPRRRMINTDKVRLFAS